MACCCGPSGPVGVCGCLNSLIVPPTQAVIAMSASVTVAQQFKPFIWRLSPCIEAEISKLFNRTITASVIEDVFRVNNNRQVVFRYAETIPSGHGFDGFMSFGIQFAVNCSGRQSFTAGVGFQTRFIPPNCSNDHGLGNEDSFTLGEMTNLTPTAGGLARFCPGGPMSLSYSATAEYRNCCEFISLGPGSFNVSIS